MNTGLCGPFAFLPTNLPTYKNVSQEPPPGRFEIGQYDDSHVLQTPVPQVYGANLSLLMLFGAGAASDLPPLPDLLLSAAILNVGANVEDGRLVESIAPPWFAILDMFQRDPSAIHKLSPRQWEELIAGAYHAAGYDEVILTPRSGDGGRDVIATKNGVCSVRIFDQVKAYSPGHVVTADEVRALVGTLAGFNNVSKGIVTTTSTFAPRLEEDRGLINLIPYRVELRPRDVLLPWLAQIRAKNVS